jgi:protein O-mannosyl-transferase
MTDPATSAPEALAAGPAVVRSRWVVLVLVAFGVIAYANTLRVPFLLDDSGSIIENPSIRRLWALNSVLAPPSDAGVGGRPLANLSLAVNYAAGGLDVRGYHAVNLALHLAAGLALYGLIRRTAQLRVIPGAARLADDGGIAAGAALLWLVHPLQTEAVTYLSQRTEVLVGLSYFLTLYALARGAAGAGGRWYGLAVLACAAGMASKEVMVTAPVVAFLYDRVFIAGSFRAVWQRRRRLYVGLAATWVILLLSLRHVHERGVGYAAVSATTYALTEISAVAHYLRLAFWPAPLVFDYGTATVQSVGEVWIPAMFLLAWLAGIGVALRRSPALGFLLAAGLLVLAPTSTIIPVAGQPVAEHRMYLPLAPLAVLVAAGLQRRLGRFGLPALLVIALALTSATILRNQVYGSAVTLWQDTLAKRPGNSRAHAALGAVLLEQGQGPAAILALRRAIELDPRSADAHQNLAMALLDANQPGPAVDEFTRSLQLRPGVASTHYNFGNALLALGRPAEAAAQQQQALVLRAAFPEARCALANALLALGQSDAAIAAYAEALKLAPGLVPAHFGLANALAQGGRAAESIPHYEATLRAVPTSLEAHYNLGNVLFAAQRYAEAATHFAAAVGLQPNFPDAHYNLGNALALTGQREKAIEQYEAALRLRPDFPGARANLETLRGTAGPARSP